MSTKIDSDKTAGQCWECLRRKVLCDGTRPVCQTCRTASLVCPGYVDQKPLKWLRPGKITRLKTSKIRSISDLDATAKAKAQADEDQDNGDKAIVVSSKRAPKTQDSKLEKRDDGTASRKILSTVISRQQTRFRVPQTKWKMKIPIDLRPDEWDYIDFMEFYNSQLLPVFKSKQMIPSIYIPPLQGSSIHTMRETVRHSLLALALSYRIMCVASIQKVDLESTNSGPTAHLWSRYYHHFGIAIRCLSQEIIVGQNNIGPIFMSIHAIVCPQITDSYTPQWRIHAVGFLELVKRCGGLRSILSFPIGSRMSVQSLIIAMTVFNSTTPSHDLLPEVFEFNLIDIYDLYDMKPYSSFLCPTLLFLDIVRINRIRFEAARKPHAPSSSQSNVCSILRHIDDCSPNDWIESSGLSHSTSLFLIADIYKSAVALYGLVALPCTATSHIGTPCSKLRQLYHTHIFRCLTDAMNLKVRVESIFWPVVVAGVSAQHGTQEEKDLIQRFIAIAVEDPFTGGRPLVASRLLKRFWESDKSGWDDCFDRPSLYMIKDSLEHCYKWRYDGEAVT
ncbi:Phomenoic acid biosynthesis cluster-specific transcriptional regulator-like protein [Cladobotryum mycophilum]|uniref:Phomenoic acid biosynthesis cluster-specific transcriptional regulator-like protein n=1 Tax=Cladobotryum mycophilum TaxID=491253 RepID=A0ABR0SGZ2_9HYPO